MSTPLLTLAMSPDTLNQSWRRLHNQHTPWSATVSRNELQQHFLKHLLLCRDQVLSNTYKPQSLRQYAMKKPDGKQRIISAQFLQDKLIQRALLCILEPRAEALFHDDSYAYRPRRNINMAMTRVRERVRIGLDWLVDADISKFFDNIPHKTLLKILRRFINDAQAMKLIELWIKQGAHHHSLLKTSRGISQGAILSPLFCNLYMHQFDNAMANANIPFVRFADDFLLFTDSKEKAKKAKDYAALQLQKMGLELHPEKTQVIRSHPTIIFLGEKLPKPMR